MFLKELKQLMVGVIGGGVVGTATARSWIEHVKEVRVFDIVKEKTTHTLQDTLQCNVVFICLPTPQKVGELGLDVSAVTSFFSQEEVRPYLEKRLYVLRSTVPVGTTLRLKKSFTAVGTSLDIVHSPEFLTARCAQVDAQIPSRNVIGIPFTSFNAPILNSMYRLRFPGTPVHVLSSAESEAVKLFQNAFFAVKVAFWNEVQELCEAQSLSYKNILEAILADGRIAPSHTSVPGPDGKFGFGGTCLPKDLSEVITMGIQQNRLGEVSKGAYTRNKVDRER